MNRIPRKFLWIGIIILLIFCLVSLKYLFFYTSEINPFKRQRIPTSDESSLVPELQRLTETIIKMQQSKDFKAADYKNTYVQVKNVINMLTKFSTFLEKPSVTNKNSVEKRQEVCPEEYKGKKLNYGYPFFRKGFGRVDCKQFIAIEKLVTLLISIPREHSKPAQSYLQILNNIAKYYNKMRVILATDKPLEENVKNSTSKLDILVENDVINGVGQSALWKKLVSKVTTPYLLIAENITHFDDDINLERLVRVLSYEPDVLIAGGAHRNLKGEWDMGCQQIVFKNWTASYQGGYYRSFNDCVVCDHISGPFMTKTGTLKDFPFDETLKFGAFHDLFWQMKKKNFGKMFVSCPDVMFNVGERHVANVEFAQFANKHNIHKIVEPSGNVRWYGCRNGYSYTSEGLCKTPKGIGLSPASMENLADAIKFCMKVCKEAGAFCEIQDGTSVGAVKFNGVLPWELDGDIVFQSANFSVLESLKGKFAEAGYSLVPSNKPKIGKDGLPGGGYFALRTRNWRIELWGYPKFESQMAVARGDVPTKVLFAGQWVTLPRNPGLFVRNRYGGGVYRHQQHWSQVGLNTGWKFYSPGSFTRCPIPGHSACLDNYAGDGNMQFRDYPN